jgi:hypothetical protein
VRTPGPSGALFCRSVQFSNQNFPQKRHSFIAQNQNFPQKKNYFLATRKDVESYTQIPGKHILALEFSNFSGPEMPPPPSSGLRAVCVVFQWLHPPFQKSWIRPLQRPIISCDRDPDQL